MGERPKALLELDGRPLIVRTIDALRAAGAGEVVVVTGHHAAQIEPVLRRLRPPVRIARNPHPDDVPVASQRVGLAAIGAAPQAVVIALADLPLVDSADVVALLDAWRRRPRGAEVMHPEVDGERGNPVVVGAAARADILAGPRGFGCRQWQAVHPGRVHAFATVNPHYRIDIDTEDDRLRFQRETGRALCWPADGTATCQDRPAAPPCGAGRGADR